MNTHKVIRAVEDFVLNFPSITGFKSLLSRDSLKKVRLIKRKGFTENTEEYVFPLQEIKDFLFGREFSRKIRFPMLNEEIKYAFPIKLNKSGECEIRGLNLRVIDDSKLIELLESCVFIDDALFVSSYVNKSRNKFFYHGFDGKKKKITLETLIKDNALFNGQYLEISFTTDPSYACCFGDSVLEFNFEKYQKSKLREIKKFREFLESSCKEKDFPFGFLLHRGNIYLGKKDYNGFYYLWSVDPYFVLTKRNFLFKKQVYGFFHKIREGFVRECTGEKYTVDTFMQLDLEKLSEEDKQNLLGFHRGESTEVRMNFDGGYISSDSLNAVYTSPKRLRFFKQHDLVEMQSNFPYLKTPNKLVPIYSTKNIPRKINQLHKKRYLEENLLLR